MKKILVATDFSLAAGNAITYAADMALSVNAQLTLLHVVQTPIGFSDMPLVMGLEDIMRSAETDMQQLKEELLLRTAGKIIIETEVGMGGFFEELKTVSERIKPYAVVMGSQGKTAAEDILFGSHAVKKIGLASDLTKVVKTTPFAEIKMLVHDFNAELHILNIGKKEVFDADIVFESGLMQEMTLALKPTFHFIDNENTDEGIMDFAEKNQIDLLIVLPHHHNLLTGIFHKSHTKQLVLHSHVPVISIHQ